MTAALLNATGLHTYYDDSHILRGVDLTIVRGESVSLMGRNGMGKTTLLRSIMGLTPPRRGSVHIQGVDMTKAAPHNIAKMGIAYVPEDRGVFPNLSVHENLVMAAHAGHDGGKEWTLDEILTLFPRLSERLDHRGDQLSGGEQQMLTIGRALMTNPILLILDEATEGLAPLIREEVWRVIKRIKAAGVAALIVDKDLDALLDIADHHLIMVKGEIVYRGDSPDLRANADLHERYLGV
ncbi:MAG: ABC transporter ATP-binding protein [Alphaproteobacteria bacterium]|jgi:branched-chain amino acid transport system ATP-binding protein